MLTNTAFCIFLPPVAMETIQDGYQTTKVIRSLCQRYCMRLNMIAKIDTDAHYVYFVRRILSYVAFCIFFNEFSFNNLQK